MTTKDLDDELQRCRRIIEELQLQKEQLEEENRYLRQAAGAFGQLAERLNKSLRRERQQAEPDRAATPPRGPEPRG
jgi:hypothetical protein